MDGERLEEVRSVADGRVAIVDFEAPPVVEVVAGVAYDGLGVEAGPYLTAFWVEHLRDKFPRVEQQPPYVPPREVFGAPTAMGQVQFEVMTGAQPSRLWISSLTGSELVQLQPGWFACNWRKTQPDTEYDHWPRRREQVASSFRQFSEFMSAQGVGTPKVTQCEVTYVNHIFPNELWSDHSQASQIFPFATASSTEGSLEQFSCQLQFAMVEEGRQFGRLHVKILPAFGIDGRSPLYVFELTARGPIESGSGGAATATDFLDKGRNAIVKTFLQLTNEDMQLRVWGRK